MTTMRRFGTVFALTAIGTASLLLGSGPAAWAKGPTEATVTGPGLAEPVKFELGMHGEAAPRYADLIDATEVFSLGARQLCRLARPPAAPLGPQYRLTWRMSSLSGYYGVDSRALHDPIDQQFYPSARGGALTRVAGSDTWIRGATSTRLRWRQLVDDLSGGGSASGRSDRVSVRGPGHAGSVPIDQLTADRSAAVEFFNDSGMAQSALYGGMAQCRESEPPPGQLGPRYTVTWSMAPDDWGVQDVYPYAAGGPVIYDREAAFDTDATGGWFRAGRRLLTVWATLGLPTQAQATGDSARASDPAAAAPESAAVAATRTTGTADGGPGVWLLALGGAAVLVIGGAVLLATSGRPGIRWRRHGDADIHRDRPPGDA